MQGVLVCEGNGGQRPVRVGIPLQQSKRLVLRDDDRMTAQRLRAADVISMRVAVDKMCYRFVANFSDRLWYKRRQILRCIDHYHAMIVNKKHRLDRVVGDHVKAASHILQTISLGWINNWSLR